MVTSTRKPPSDIVGKVEAITVLNRVKRGGPAQLALVFWLMRHVRLLTAPLRKLSFIHFARWTLVKRIPYNGPPQQREHLNYQYLIFTSNFNGSWDQYIDAFAWTTSWQVQQIWKSSFGFPGPLPVEPFLAFTRENQYMPSHLCSAYPGATLSTILNALELKKRHTQFHDRASDLSPEQFEAVYQQFVTDVQSYLT